MRSTNKLWLPPDVYFRHWLIANKIQQGNILDVGGSLRELNKFINADRVVTVDVIGGDVIYRGYDLPFLNDSFEQVVSVDTLEHIPSEKRLYFIKQMLRVAKKRICILAPYASDEHIKMENEMIRSYRKAGIKPPDYLREHIEYGLIDDKLLQEAKNNLGSKASFYGQVKVDKLNFKIHTFEVKFPRLNKLIYELKFLWNYLINTLIPISFWLLWPARSGASRVMIIIEK